MQKKIKIQELLNPLKDRSLVRRRHAADYLLITLLSFAFSVAGTRLFLDLTGYPQLGGGSIHIAHVLWGGVILFAAALLPVIFLNEWIFALSAFLTGLGVGLFIDEVGKFITQTNDYFSPSAAPIIYVLFLLTFFVFTQVRSREGVTTRSKMYGILERFAEVLDRDFSSEESAELIKRLDEIIKNSTEQDLVKLAGVLRKYLDPGSARITKNVPTILERTRSLFERFELKWLTKKTMKIIIVIGLFAWGIWALVAPIGYLALLRDPQLLQTFIDQLTTNRLLSNASGLTWFETRVLLEGSMGVISIIAALLLILKIDKAAIWIGIADLLLTLTIVNLLVFYFDQFSTMVGALFPIPALWFSPQVSTEILEDQTTLVRSEKGIEMTEPSILQVPFPESYWVIPGKFMAGHSPNGFYEDETRKYLRSLIQIGINVFIDLTQPGEKQFSYPDILDDEASHQSSKVEYKNFPIVDRSIGKGNIIKEVLDEIDSQISSGHAIYLHCLAGIGRTGTVVGCYLVRHGMDNEEAFNEIRRLRSNVPTRWIRSPESDEQVNLIKSWKKGQ